MKKLMLGNAAVARGLYEAGCRFVSAYPGTPSTEILETVAKHNPGDVYVEWSVNEKAGMEVAAAAAYAGARTMVTMKQVGLNVAADPLMSLAYVAVVNAAEVRVKAGDDAAEAGWFRINMTRTAINRESGVITYHLELTRGDTCLSANLDYRRWYGALTDNEEWTLHDSEGLAFDHAKIIAEAFKKGQRMT